MTRVTLDIATIAKLNIGPPVEICDPSGKVVGYLTPAAGSAPPLSTEVPFSPEELEAFRREPGGRSLDAIMHDIEGV